MDNLAEEMDQAMLSLASAGMHRCAPRLNPKGDPKQWLSDFSAPRKKLENEKPRGQTISYDKLLQNWREWRVR